MPPFLGTRVAKGIPLDDIAAYLNETALFRNQWGYRPEPGEDDAEFKERVRAELRERLDEAKAEACSSPRSSGATSRSNADGNDLVVYSDDDAHGRARAIRLPAPAPATPYLCIADFFRPAESAATRDYAALPDRDMGARVSGEHCRAVRGGPLHATT